MTEGDEKAETVLAFSLVLPKSRRVPLMLEPYGMTFDVAPGTTVEVRVVPPSSPPTVVVDDEYISVWCEGGWAGLFVDGVELGNYIPTKRELEYFESDEYKERMRRHDGRREGASAVLDRYREQHPDEMRELMETLASSIASGDRNDAKRALAAVPEDVRAALRESGLYPFID
jgi:hypothetical protein